jgi:hypothetical protein
LIVEFGGKDIESTQQIACIVVGKQMIQNASNYVNKEHCNRDKEDNFLGAVKVLI